MTLQTTRPVALEVLPENIPAEIKALRVWTNWRYEWNEKRSKWDKIPYTPYTTKKAASTRPSTWRTFDEAYACYLERRDYFDGVFFTLQKSDPYTGGDFDHDTDAARVPATYAELSPSGNGQRFIGIGTIPSACKKPAGELYSRARFLSITGHKLPSAPPDIRPIQDALDTLYAQLKGARAITAGNAGSGSRAELAAQIPEDDWQSGRRLARNEAERQRLIDKRLPAAFPPHTQTGMLIREEYAAFHQKWSFVGIFRADGTLDDSMVRAVVARGIRQLGFTLPEYLVIMSNKFAAQALAKWGNRARWREELAALWFKSPAPNRPFVPKPAKEKKHKIARGRASNHAATLEQVYSLLLEHKAGRDAIIHIADLAAAIGAHRGTVTRLLIELANAGRISKRRLAGGGGLVITFIEPKRDVIIDAAPAPELPAPARINDVAPIYAEETKVQDVFLPDRAEADHISEPPTLAELARNYLDQPAEQIGERLVSSKTGVISYRRTAKHFAQLVTTEYPYSAAQAIVAYQADQARRKREAAEAWQRFFSDLRAMSDADLIAYIGGGCRRGVADLARDGAVFDKHLYQTRLKCAKQQLRWRGLTMPKRSTKTQQQAKADAAAVAAARQQRQQRPRLVACEPIHYVQPSAPAGAAPAGIVERLRLLKAQRESAAAIA
jgi:hypothetical protein